MTRSLRSVTSAEWADMKPGERLTSTYEQASDFKSLLVDGANVMGAPPDAMIVSLYRTEPRNITATFVFEGLEGTAGAKMGFVGLEATPVSVEVAHLRMTPEVATDVAIAILLNLVDTAGADVLRDRLGRATRLKQLIIDNVD